MKTVRRTRCPRVGAGHERTDGRGMAWRLDGRARAVIIGGVLFFCSATSAAEEIRVAVAANFLVTLEEIVARFEQDTGHVALVTSGSSGKFYAQIRNGAPFDVFFSADVMRPKLLEEEGFAVQGSRLTYAVGRLTLWRPGPTMVEKNGTSMLLSDTVKYVAIANPKTAPYGTAAEEVLRKLGLWERIQGRLVRGENVGQTFHFVFSRNAQLGFVALAQVLGPKVNGTGSRWDVPAHWHAPLQQQVVLLRKGRHNGGAHALLDYVQGATSRNIIERFGYGLE